jgi:hypothetical protein
MYAAGGSMMLTTMSGGSARNATTAGVKSLPARSSVSYLNCTFGAFTLMNSAMSFAWPMP